jgi:hypothetical protein
LFIAVADLSLLLYAGVSGLGGEQRAAAESGIAMNMVLNLSLAAEDR